MTVGKDAAGTRLRYGMVGGGPGAFIGSVHRSALALDGRTLLAAGCFSQSAEKTRAIGRDLGVAEDRLYDSWSDMARAEEARADGIDFAVIVTPNHLHYPAAKSFLEAGIHVACDKPLAVDAAEAEELESLARRRNLLFCVTYTYRGYPAVKQARRMLAQGAIGEVRFVQAEYLQEAFARPAEREGSKQAEWRFDPGRAGPAAALGDIGTHALDLAGYVTGLELRRVSARLSTLVDGRRMDDTGTMMTEYAGGIPGLLWFSQAAAGHGNDLSLRVLGSEGTLSWRQEEPDRLRLCRLGEPERVLVRGRDAFYPDAEAFRRLPAGHPEGFIEALANVYAPFTASLAARDAGTEPEVAYGDYPDAEAGVLGVRFVRACIESSRMDCAWVELSRRS